MPDVTAPPPRRPKLTLAERLLRPETIFFQPEVLEYARGREILERYPDATRVEVTSHQNIPGLFGNEGAARDWVKIKRTVLVLGVRKTLPVRPNGRSADFIAPGHASGCLGACLYCYVPRHKGFANPVTLFVNIEQIGAAIKKHAARQGPKAEPNQTDPHLWTYDIGENSDCSADALLSDNVRDLVALFKTLPHAKRQVAAEVIFLTHHAGLHDVNVRWHPKGEALIWRPDLQEAKTTGQGGDALRYRHGLKGSLVGEFRALLARKLPFCRVRYAF